MAEIVDNRLVKLAKAAQEQAGGMTIDERYEAVIAGLQRERAMVAKVYEDAANFDMTAAWRQYASILNKPVQDLTEGEKQQAFLNHILEKSDGA